ncbi:(2Fe-2S)-binding protein [Propionigenium maris DSM 9537]|uniref:(2Fe-2S)-binding protein n=1 Tax=Propionigenium maris DSM 9537 TaxID=1123000 RepID=A0A9W6GNS4_9FUSO|nr:(2Fe-2S)-binding protein [Propionigenium maris]GLI57066.1 (2Fe-2S)-binding protein [Propionigenium maris DSM 9537]
MKIRFKLNNKDIEYCGPPMARLIDFIRDTMGVTSCKIGCGEGECGACSVLIDGRLALACITPVGQVRNKSVLTVEGIRDTREFSILKRSFEEHGSVQCGFCIPGMILAAYSLLKSTPNPREEEIREAISGNLCRCTGYLSIIEAIKSAAREVEKL